MVFLLINGNRIGRMEPILYLLTKLIRGMRINIGIRVTFENHNLILDIIQIVLTAFFIFRNTHFIIQKI